MNELTLTKMNQMKLHGMYGAFKTAIETGKTDSYTLDQFISMLIEAEWDDKKNRKIERMIKAARFHYKSSVEDIIYNDDRNISKNSFLRLAECNYINSNENVLITGSTGVGKSYIATALGYQALLKNTTGSSNVAVGTSSLDSNTTGYINTSVGNYSGRSTRRVNDERSRRKSLRETKRSNRRSRSTQDLRRTIKSVNRSVKA